MHGLEKGINQLANYELDPKIRSSAVSMLNGIIDDLNAGIKVWEDFMSSGNLSSDAGLYGGWAGFNIEKKLFELDLEARDKAKQASSGASSLDDPLVALAYKKLDDSETASDRSQTAIDSMRERIEKIKSFINLINSTKPKKAAVSGSAGNAKKVSTKSAGKKKTTTKAKKAKKKAVKKKSTQKKSASKKKAPKKKAAKKKAVKKKAAKKKAVKKKVPKKKVTKKQVSKKKPKKKAKRR